MSTVQCPTLNIKRMEEGGVFSLAVVLIKLDVSDKDRILKKLTQ